jgi:hypothetical protein
MIVVAGTAVCLAAGGSQLVNMLRVAIELGLQIGLYARLLPTDPWLFWSGVHDDLRNTLWYGFQLAQGILAGMWIPFLVLRLRRPRPPLREVLFYPGTVAWLAMAVGLFWVTGYLLMLFPEGVDSFTAAPIAAGGTVAVVWAILVLTRNWKPEPGWVDELGRLLGCAAIGNALLGLFVYRI